MQSIIDKIRALAEQARTIHTEERRPTLASVKVVGALAHLNAAVNLGMSKETFARWIGLEPSTYFMRASVANVLWLHPEAERMLAAGETEVSTLSLVAPKITQANAKVILDG